MKNFIIWPRILKQLHLAYPQIRLNQSKIWCMIYKYWRKMANQHVIHKPYLKHIFKLNEDKLCNRMKLSAISIQIYQIYPFLNRSPSENLLHSRANIFIFDFLFTIIFIISYTKKLKLRKKLKNLPFFR